MEVFYNSACDALLAESIGFVNDKFSSGFGVTKSVTLKQVETVLRRIISQKLAHASM
jgi:hypothetical protein